jgi:hypothetical protein
MINLNEASYDAKEGKAIFNNGVAGIVENVTISVVKKKADDKETLPDYQLVFTDAQGGSTNTGFYQITKDLEYNGKVTTIADQVKKRGTLFKHLLHALYGTSYEIPSFSSAEEMLHVTMRLIMEASKSGNKFRVMSSYNKAGYINVRGWVPCVESMATALADTILKVSNIENYVKVTADSAPSVEAKKVDDDWA